MGLEIDREQFSPEEFGHFETRLERCLEVLEKLLERARPEQLRGTALAAGAMLTAIAESMLPEAFEQGGAIVGMATLLGFLAAMLVKLV